MTTKALQSALNGRNGTQSPSNGSKDPQIGLIPLIRAAHREATRVFEDLLSVVDAQITGGQAVVLLAIDAMPDITQRGLSSLTGIDRSTMSTMIAVMEKHGLVKRKRVPGDGRSLTSELTPTAKKLMPKLARAYERASAKLAARIEAGSYRSTRSAADMLSAVAKG